MARNELINRPGRGESRGLTEGSEFGDLKRLVMPVVTIDEFRSKMGDDEDICVITFSILGKEPGNDLVNFIEKGYDWVLDADLSSGEISDGNYLVFVEIERSDKIPGQVIELVNDILNLTEQDISDWAVSYRSDKKKYPVTADSIIEIVPLSREAYETRDAVEDTVRESLDYLRSVAGVTVTTKAPANEYTEMLRTAAGIR